jgi:hydroxymethylpyrimidine kinase/phosphomethylpyrimidine kinase
MTQKSLVSIAGWDPSGGAGVLLDIRVFERLGRRGHGVLSAVTAQSPARVAKVFPVTGQALTDQFTTLSEAIEVGGIKVGMLATGANLRAAARILEKHEGLPRVIDPVLKSSSGACLLERRAWPRFLETVEGRASLITPNMDEAAALAGLPVRDESGMRRAAEKIHLRSGLACLVKGGHLEGRALDILFDGREFAVFAHEKSRRNVHGTGCFLASAILCYLAEGRPLKEACGLGIVRVARAIRAAVPAGPNVWVFDFTREGGRVPLPPRPAG